MKKFTEDLYYLFRPGMELRKKHVVELFNTDILELLHPDLIEKNDLYFYRGTEKLKSQLDDNPFKFNISNFMMAAPDIHKMFLEGKKLKAGELNKLPDSSEPGVSQIAWAFKTGFLKHSSQGFYFDPKGKSYYYANVENDLR